MMTSAPVTFRGRLWRWTKRLALFTTMLVIGTGAAGYFGLPLLAKTGWARVKVEQAINKSLGTDLHVTDMAFTWRNGLTLRGVSTPEMFSHRAPMASVEQMKVKPNYKKLLKGKVRLNILLERPELVLWDPGPEVKPILFPRFTRHKVQFEKVEIRDGTYVRKSIFIGTPKEIRIENINVSGAGRLEKRAFRLELETLAGSMDATKIEGKGVVRVTPEGLGGELDVNEPTNLREALRPAGLTIKKAPVLSDPF